MCIKKYIFFLLSALAIASCETIDEGERWLEAPRLSGVENPILIEEYTGQECINCPEAAELLHEIVKQSKVPHIIVAMHSPYSGLTLPMLEVKEAKEYSLHFNHKRIVPGIMINRNKLSTGLYYDMDKAKWASLISQVAHQPIHYALELSAESDVISKKIDVSIKSALLKESASKNVGLQLWLVEDVVAPQRSHTGWLKEYEHHNVFRASLNGTWGEDYIVGKDYTKSFVFPANLEKIQNAKLVAYLFDTKTKAILLSKLVPIQLHY